MIAALPWSCRILFLYLFLVTYDSTMQHLMILQGKSKRFCSKKNFAKEKPSSVFGHKKQKKKKHI